MKQKLFIFLTVLLPFLAVVMPYFHQGVPYTHDGENHLARFANYKIALREGQFPPRFAPNLMNHYGYPVFNYNYPLLNILSLPLSITGIHYELTFKLLMITGLAVGCWGVFSWLKSCGFSRESRLIAVSAYLLAPFTVNLFFVRGSIGELWALALFPWLLWLTKTVKHSQPVSLLVSVPLVTAFFLSHNVSVLFGSVLWALYTIQKFGRQQQLWKTWLKPVILAGLLSLWFWLPALAEKQFVVLDDADLSSQFSRHFSEPLQLLTSPLQFGYSFETAVDTMSLAAGWMGIVSLCLMTLWFIKPQQKAIGQQTRWLRFFAAAGWALLFLQTAYSYYLWRWIPFVPFIQFPWRLMLFFTVLVLPLAAELFARHVFFKKLLWILLIIQLTAVWRLEPLSYLHKTNAEYDAFPQSTSTLNENRVKGFTYLLIGDWQPAPTAISGQIEVTVEHWTGSSRRYRLTVSETALITEPTMYFQGWETTVNGQRIAYADRTATEGRLGYWLEPGEYMVESRFTQKTWARIAGNTISAAALLFWAWSIWQEKRTSSGKLPA